MKNYDRTSSMLKSIQKEQVVQRGSKEISSYIHIDPRRGRILVNSMSPVIKMKKIKLQQTNTASQSIAVLPELTTADEHLEEETAQFASKANTVDQPQPEFADTGLTFVQNMTNEELQSHIQKCLEMSSENKITPKNAFALQLIDCFQKLLEEKKQDFSKMACTLDAGAKIYSYRIDGLHQQVVKLADEVVSHQPREANSNEEDGGKGKRKEKRKMKKNVIATLDSLKRKMKGRDPRNDFIKLDGTPGAIMSGVRRDPKDFSFTLENNLDFWPNFEKHKPVRAQGSVELPDFKVTRRARNPSEESSSNGRSLGSNGDFDRLCDENQTHNNCEVLMADEVEPEVFEEPPADDVDEVMSQEVEVIATAMKRLHKESQANGFGAPSRFEAMKIIFNAASEYDYLSMKNCHYWAGPDFWKKSKPINERDDSNISRKKKKKTCNEINYETASLEVDWTQISKRAPKLAMRTLVSWKKKKTTYPHDLKIDVKMLEPFIISSEFLKAQDTAEYANTSNEDTKDMTNDEDTNSSTSFDHLDAGFHEGPSGSPDDDDHLNAAFYDSSVTQGLSLSSMGSTKLINVEINSLQISQFGESSLVAPPKKVKVNPIKYSTRPVRVNMHHLKETMLQVIQEDIEGGGIQNETTTGAPNGQRTAFFSELLKKLPSRLERRTAEDLTPAMAFLALLTLANENNLDLANTGGEGEDVSIRFEQDQERANEELGANEESETHEESLNINDILSD